VTSPGLKRLYDRLPANAQSLLLGAWHLKLDRERYGPRFRHAVEELARSERASVDAVREVQEARLRTIVLHAARNVPFYARRFADHGVDLASFRGLDDLRRLPVLTRADIVSHFDELVATNVDRRSLVIGHTSGTTGSPLEVLHDPGVTAMTYALLDRQYRWAGLRLGRGGDRVAVMRGNVIVPIAQSRPPYWRVNHVHRQVLLSSFHLSEANLPGYVDAIRAFGAVALDGYPSTVYLLARFVARAGLSLPMRAVVTSSETLYPFQREAIEAAFGCRVFDYYAAAERVVFATECEAHEGHHLSPEYGVTEFVDDAGSPVAAGTTGAMLGTSLHNFGMPLIRYRCNDMSAFRAAACSCGRPLPLMDDVATKAEDIIALADGRMISPSVLTHPFKPMHSVEESQIVQEAYDRIVILVKPNAKFTEAEREHLVREFGIRLGRDVKIDVEVVDRIPRTASGKFKWVVSKVDRAVRVPG
jgi:phenylacetate-CoA ligase